MDQQQISFQQQSQSPWEPFPGSYDSPAFQRRMQPESFSTQTSEDYASLKAACLRDGRLYEDPDFGAESSTIGPEYTISRPYAWKRPKELVSDPKFLVAGASRFDIAQGDYIGDCWFVASAALLATKPELFERVVPPEQTFEDGDYAGIFHFRFWYFGEWVEIVIDDRLPVGRDDEMKFAHNKITPNEYWPALLEKAYAKLHGHYEALEGGLVREALVDFTGGISEHFDLKKPEKIPDDFFDLVMRTFQMSSILGAEIWSDPKSLQVERMPNGLYKGHAYSITNVAKITIRGREHQLLRLRNPYAMDEWQGEWSDSSPIWQDVTEEQKQDFNLRVEDEGEFWMPFEDFMREFDNLDLVHLDPSSFTGNLQTTFKGKLVWNERNHKGRWIKGVNAGGCGLLRPYEDLYYTNPQYVVHLVDPDPTDTEDKCIVIISIMQGRTDRLMIGVDVHLMKDGVPALLDGQNYGERAFAVKEFRSRTAARELSCRLRLNPGTYCVIPNALKANQEGPFLLRILTIQKIDTSLIDEPTGPILPRPGSTLVIGAIDRKLPETPTPSTTPITTTTTTTTTSITTPTITPTVSPGAPGPVERIDDDMYRQFAGEDYLIDAKDLRDLLNALCLSAYGSEGGFSLETARSLLAMYDTWHLGVVSSEEASKVWAFVKNWKERFDRFDKDNSRSIDSLELRRIFRDSGFSLSLASSMALSVRYGGRLGSIGFDDFILLVAKTKRCYDSFISFQPNPKEDATVNLEQWMEAALYL